MKIKIYAFSFLFCYTRIGYIYFCFRLLWCLTEIRIIKIEDGLISTTIGIQFCKIVKKLNLLMLILRFDEIIG